MTSPRFRLIRAEPPQPPTLGVTIHADRITDASAYVRGLLAELHRCVSQNTRAAQTRSRVVMRQLVRSGVATWEEAGKPPTNTQPEEQPAAVAP